MLKRHSTIIDFANGVLRGSVLFLIFIAILIFDVTRCEAFEAKVRYVIDGDTFILDNNKSVRLASIDTPEIGRDGKPDQYYAQEAKHTLEGLIGGKRVRIAYAGGGSDKYKRIVGWVYVDGLPVNEYMVRKGAAYFYYHPENSGRMQHSLLQAQLKAYKDMAGFWPVISKGKGFKISWVGNKRSRRCFPEGDKNGSRISRKNRVVFSDLGQAFGSGYSPARNTGFWPDAGR